MQQIRAWVKAKNYGIHICCFSTKHGAQGVRMTSCLGIKMCLSGAVTITHLNLPNFNLRRTININKNITKHIFNRNFITKTSWFKLTGNYYQKNK